MAIDINIESQVSQTITDGVTDKAPSENAVFDALSNKANTSDIITDHSELNLDDGTNPHGTTKSDVGLSDVPNLDTTDAVNKAHDSVTLTGTPNYITIVGQAITRGLIDLANHVTGRLGFNHLPTGTARSVVGRAGSGNGDLGNISAGNNTILSRVGSGDVAFNSVSDTKQMLALNNVDNTSDLNKPISTATQSALDLKIGGAVSIGQVAFGTASGVGGDSGLFWDNTNKRLGIGTSTPTARLHVQAQGALSTDVAFRVRNSADTFDIFTISGNGNVWSRGGGNVSSNTSFGELALRLNSTGADLTAFGVGALANSTTASNNCAFGSNTLFSNTTGFNNTAIGRSSLLANTTAGNNNAFGFFALASLTTGASNAGFGRDAGRYIAGGTLMNTTGSNSIFFGNLTKALGDNQTNQIVIGHDTTGNGSNTVTLGNTSIVDTVLRGRVNLTQYATGSRPTYVKGALIYDSTLGKLLVGGNSGWEVVTSI
jgi:hypothetical protein